MECPRFGRPAAAPPHRSPRGVRRLSCLHARRLWLDRCVESRRCDEPVALSLERRGDGSAHDRPRAGHRANRHAHGTGCLHQLALAQCAGATRDGWQRLEDAHVALAVSLGAAFSPDGTEIAVSRSEVDGSWHIWAVPVSGGAPRRLTATEDGEVYPRYAPDGQSLFFHSWKTPRRIGKIGRQGGRAELLTFGDGNDAFPDVSLDGRLLLITRTEKDAERLYVAPSSGGAVRLLTTTPGALGRWSPDGRSVAFSGNRAYSGGIFVVSTGDGRSRRLTESGGWPVWRPDGRGLAYLVARPDAISNPKYQSSQSPPMSPYSAAPTPFLHRPTGSGGGGQRRPRLRRDLAARRGSGEVEEWGMGEGGLEA